MVTLVNQDITNSIPDLIQVSNSGAGIDGTLRPIQSGIGTSSGLNISTTGASVTGTFAVSGAATFSTTMAVGGTLSGAAATFSSTFNASGNSTFGGTLGITGLTTFTDSATIGGTLGVTGLTTLSGSAKIIGSIKDTNSNNVITIGSTGSAVNALTVTNSATGSAPTIAATGADSTINLVLQQKGAASVDLGATSCTGVRLIADQAILDSSSNKYLGFTKLLTAVNFVNFSNAATAGNPKVIFTGSDSNVSGSIGCKGTGVINTLYADSRTNANADALIVQGTSSGTAAAGYSTSIAVQGQNGAGTVQTAARFAAGYTTVTAASEKTYASLYFYTAGTLAERYRFSSTVATAAVPTVITQANTAIRTLTLPDNDINYTTVAFGASASGNQTLSGTPVKIQFNTVDFDTNSNFDGVTNFRFTPTVAGKYQVNLVMTFTFAAAGTITLDLRKNGSSLKTSSCPNPAAATESFTGVVSYIVTMNGTTDFLEGFASTNAGSPATVGGAVTNAFSAFKII